MKNRFQLSAAAVYTNILYKFYSSINSTYLSIPIVVIQACGSIVSAYTKQSSICYKFSVSVRIGECTTVSLLRFVNFYVAPASSV